jgi:SanA protein
MTDTNTPQRDDAAPAPARKRRWRRRLILWPLIAGVLLLAVVFGIDSYISVSTNGDVYDDASAVPDKPVALLLGCSKYFGAGYENPFYSHRIDAAAELYRAGKVRGILVSGDNSRKSYDEPSDIRADLIAQGVPGEYITLDYAGFRTWDSLVRARDVFGQQSMVIISQRFHCQRAIFLARKLDLDVVGYAAKDVGGRGGRNIRRREILARNKAVIDLLTGADPKFLGDAEHVTLRPPDSD